MTKIWFNTAHTRLSTYLSLFQVLCSFIQHHRHCNDTHTHTHTDTQVLVRKFVFLLVSRLCGDERQKVQSRLGCFCYFKWCNLVHSSHDLYPWQRHQFMHFKYKIKHFTCKKYALSLLTEQKTCTHFNYPTIFIKIKNPHKYLYLLSLSTLKGNQNRHQSVREESWNSCHFHVTAHCLLFPLHTDNLY